jgi:hypothetical protein
MSRLAKVYIGSIVALICFSILSNVLGFSILGTLKSVSFWAVFILSAYFVLKFANKLLQKLLWRIRRKLIISYFFIGVIPILLLFIL